MPIDPSDVSRAGVKQGDILAGKYRVDRVLGVGGMGVVVAAHHVHLDEYVAIKFLLPDALSNAEAVARFDREARAAVKIKSEHVARVIDVGKLENGAPYMIMEYLDGKDLGAWVAERGPLPVEQAVEFVLQACEAIAEAHAIGIVHRDLKPANLFCIRRPDGGYSIKVLDFGISKATGMGSGMGMTGTQAVMGSPLYMSPEQMESSKGVDPRADIWALGVVLFELVAGRVPFDGMAITELVLKIVTAPPPTLHGTHAGIPPGLDPVIQKCLEKKRDQRYQNVSEFANALLPFGPPQARLSVDRIAGIMQGAGAPPRGLFQSAPPPPRPHIATQQIGSTGGTPVAVAPPQPHIGAPTQAMTDSSWGNTGPTVPRSGPRTAVVLGVVAAVVLTAVLIAVLVTRKSPAAASATPPAPSASIAVAAAIPPPAPIPPAPSATDGTASDGPGASTASAPTTPPTAVNPGRPPPARPGAGPAPGPAPGPAKPAPKANCDPPYFMDASGHRQYKPECL
jgi:serine/threonine protein kinase